MKTMKTTKEMKTMKTTNGMIIALTAGILLAAGVGAEVTAVSAETQLDTRSFTVDWSQSVKLNTIKYDGTLILIR